MSNQEQTKAARQPRAFIRTIYFPVLGGIIIGWLVYGIIVMSAYETLAEQIKTVEVFDKIVERDPAFYALISRSNFHIDRSSDRDEIEWRLLTDLGVIPPTKEISDISAGIKTRLDALMANQPSRPLKSITFLQLFIETLDLEKNNQPPSQRQNLNLEDYLADCIARKPQSLYYLSAYNKNTDQLEEGKSAKANHYQYFIPRAINEDIWGGRTSLNNVLGILYGKNNFDQIYRNLPDSVRNLKTDYYEDYRQIRDFHQRLLMSLNDVPEVLHAKNHIFYVEGPEQLAMFILTVIALLMLLQRILWVKKIWTFSNEEPRYLLNLKRWFRWIIVSMPLFGFIGTKRGLSEALTQSDSIIRAGSEINQAMAMNNVTYSLGIAFTTTLVALVLSLLLNFLDNIVKGYENDLDID